MRVFIQEIKKNFIKRYIFLLVLLVVIIKAIYGLAFEDSSDYVNGYIEADKEIYMEYMAPISGKSTDEKEFIINNIISEYEEVEKKVSSAADLFISKEMTEKEYAKLSLEAKSTLDKRELINALRSQQNYVNMDRENRYYVYQNGWLNFFGEINIDYWLIVILIIAITSVFCVEYETEMNVLNLIAVNGREKLFLAKSSMSILFAIITSTIFFVESLIINNIKYGLTGYSYPIQSISILGKCNWELSIGEVVLLVYLLYVIGAVYTVVLILTLSTVLKRPINTILITVSIIFIPMYLLEEKVVFNLPLPTGFVYMYRYVHGFYDNNAEGKIYYSIKDLSIKISMAVLIMIFLMVVAKREYIKKKSSISLKRKLLKNLIFIGTMIACILLFSGCSRKKSDKKEVINNNIDACILATDDYFIDGTKIPYSLENNGNICNLFRDVFMDEDDYEKIKMNYLNDNILCYIRYYDNFMNYDICLLDLDSYENKTIYSEREFNKKGIDYLINDSDDFVSGYEKEEQLKEQISSCIVADNKIFAIASENIYQIDLSDKFSNKKEIIIDNCSNACVAYAKGEIFYINDTYNLEIYSVEDKTNSIISDYLISELYALEDKLILRTMDENLVMYDYDNK